MFRKIDDSISVAGQITPEDVAAAAAQGFAMIVINRPEEEEAGQPSGEAIRVDPFRPPARPRHRDPIASDPRVLGGREMCD